MKIQLFTTSQHREAHLYINTLRHNFGKQCHTHTETVHSDRPGGNRALPGRKLREGAAACDVKATTLKIRVVQLCISSYPAGAWPSAGLDLWPGYQDMSLTSFFGSSCQSSNSIAGNWHSAILTNRACTKIGHLKGSTSSPEASKTLRLKAVLPFPARPEQADGRWWNECMLMALRGGGGGVL